MFIQDAGNGVSADSPEDLEAEDEDVADDSVGLWIDFTSDICAFHIPSPILSKLF